MWLWLSIPHAVSNATARDFLNQFELSHSTRRHFHIVQATNSGREADTDFISSTHRRKQYMRRKQFALQGLNGRRCNRLKISSQKRPDEDPGQDTELYTPRSSHEKISLPVADGDTSVNSLRPV
jgi:hypothetical protein